MIFVMTSPHHVVPQEWTLAAAKAVHQAQSQCSHDLLGYDCVATASAALYAALPMILDAVAQARYRGWLDGYQSGTFDD